MICAKSSRKPIISRNNSFHTKFSILSHCFSSVYYFSRIKYRVLKIWAGVIAARNNYRLGIIGLIIRNEIDIAANGVLALSRMERFTLKYNQSIYLASNLFSGLMN